MINSQAENKAIKALSSYGQRVGSQKLGLSKSEHSLADALQDVLDELESLKK